MPDGSLGTAYTALGEGDSSQLLALLPDDFEWIEPELAGYPLAGVHHGAAAVASGVFEPLETVLAGLTFSVSEVLATDDRVVATGVMRGLPAGAEEDWELPFAHVWELSDGEPARVRAYFDRSRLTLAAARRQLADVADDLLDQAAEIRRQWAELGDALRAAGADAPHEPAEPAGADAEEALAGAASARLAAVDMAHEGATREEVDAYLRGDLGVDDPTAILDEVFGEFPSGEEPATAEEQAAALEANRLSRLFARNRS